MNGRLRYAILGPLEVRDGSQVLVLGAAKQRVLLACLLLRGGRQTLLTDLYDALWGDELPALLWDADDLGGSEAKKKKTKQGKKKKEKRSGEGP